MYFTSKCLHLTFHWLFVIEICMFFFIIIKICPQAVGTEVQRDCNFKAHICRFSYLLGCISSLWFILSSQLPYSSSNLNRLVHKDFPPPQGLFPRLNFNRWSKNYSCQTGGPSSRLEKKPTINSWTRHALCDSVLSYERNRWKFEHVIRNSMGNGILSIYNSKYFEIWIFYA